MLEILLGYFGKIDEVEEFCHAAQVSEGTKRANN